MFLAKAIGVKRVAIIGEDSLFPQSVGGRRRGLGEASRHQGGAERELYAQADRLHRAASEDQGAPRGRRSSRTATSRTPWPRFASFSELNINLKIFAGTVGPGLPKFAKQLGNTAEYVLGFSQWEPRPEILKFPGMKHFIDSYVKRHGVKPNYHAGIAWVSMQVMTQAITEGRLL